MPSRFDWLSRIKAVEREYLAIRRAVDRFLGSAKVDSSILGKDLSVKDVVDASAHLEGTYLTRLFAEFESGLRQYWATQNATQPRMADLLNGLAARRLIPDPQRDGCHSVRDYRNTLIHEREDEAAEVGLATARGYLCRFMSYLPPEW